MPGGIAIGDLGDNTYKHFELQKLNKIKMEEILLKVKEDHYRRVKKVLK